VQKFRVRLKGFRFLAFVPPGAKLDQEGVLVDAVKADKLKPAAGRLQVPCDWLEVEAKNAHEAEAAFKAVHKIKKPRAPFVVESLAPGPSA
jgi:hypothetical protein